MRKLLIMMIALMVSIAAADTAQAAKKKPFYDAKSQLLGISGDVEALQEKGFKSKIFINDVKISDDIVPNPLNNNGWSDEQIVAITEELNRQRIGHQVLAFLFPYEIGLNGKRHLSDKVMNQRALINAQFADIEKANASALDATSILQDDWMPLLSNNFIYIERKTNTNSGMFKPSGIINISYMFFHVEIDKNTLEQVLYNWDNPEGFETINPKVSFVYTNSDKYDGFNHQKFQRKISKEVPEFAIRGQLTGRNPATARIGKNDGLNKGDAVSIYRQRLNENGEMVSDRISRARVNYLDDENCQLLFIGGNRGSDKNGDMVVLEPDRRLGLGFYGNYSLGKFYGGSITFDALTFISKSGLSGRLLFQLRADYADYDKKLFDEFGVNAPLVLDYGLGYGLAWTALGQLEFMPYVTVEAEQLISLGDNKKNVDFSGWGIRGAGGLRFDINIAYPVKLSLGAEYAHVFALDELKITSKSASYKAFEEILKGNGGGSNHELKRSGINFFAGLRFVF